MSGIVEQVAAAGIRASDLSRLRLLIPYADELRQFDAAIGQFELRISENLDENNTLAKLRDTLLPKLISGELRIPQAEKMVEEAVA